MRYLVALATAFFLAVLAASALSPVKVLGITPDFVLIFAACWAMVRGQGEAWAVVPLAGLLRDLTGSDPLGTSVLALAPIVLLAAAVELRAMESEFVPTLAVVAAGSLAHALVIMAVLSATGQAVPWGDGLIGVVLPSMVVNALFTPILYLPIRWLSRRPSPYAAGSSRTAAL